MKIQDTAQNSKSKVQHAVQCQYCHGVFSTRAMLQHAYTCRSLTPGQLTQSIIRRRQRHNRQRSQELRHKMEDNSAVQVIAHASGAQSVPMPLPPRMTNAAAAAR